MRRTAYDREPRDLVVRFNDEIFHRGNLDALGAKQPRVGRASTPWGCCAGSGLSSDKTARLRQRLEPLYTMREVRVPLRREVPRVGKDGLRRSRR